MALDKKTTSLFKLMELFLTQHEISNDDPYILDEFDCSYRTLDRYLEDIENHYDHIITIKKSRKKVWKLVKVSDIFEEFIKNSHDISQLFLMAREFDSEIFKELEKGTFSKIAKNDENIFLFKNSIMEEIQDENTKQIFNNLKQAIKNHEYRTIVYKDKNKVFKNQKCLKLIFIDNNWYIAVIDEDKKLFFRRLSFIKKVDYSSKNSYQRKDIKPYLKFLENIQNSMTLYGVKPKTATIKVASTIAKYFEPDMKKFLPSQQFISKEDDGSIILSLSYTQELEILPFIQRWLPDIIILEPDELKKVYIEKLKRTSQNHIN